MTAGGCGPEQQTVSYYFAATRNQIKTARWKRTWKDLKFELMVSLRFVYPTARGVLRAMSDLHAAREPDFAIRRQKAARLQPSDVISPCETLVLFRGPPSQELLQRLARQDASVLRAIEQGGGDRPPCPDEPTSSSTTDRMRAALAESERQWLSSDEGAGHQLRQALTEGAVDEPSTKRPRDTYTCHVCGRSGEHFIQHCPYRDGGGGKGPIYKEPVGIPTSDLRRVSLAEAETHKVVFKRSDGTLWVRRVLRGWVGRGPPPSGDP